MKLDQHFVTDEELLSKIAEISDIQEDETILELGAGKGNLTLFLLPLAKKVYSIEIDEDLQEYLVPILEEYPNMELIWGNALEVRWPKFDKIVANIPYSISEPLLQKLIFSDFKKAVLLVSRHFSDILLDKTKTKLSIVANSFFDIEPVFDVSPYCFDPPPKVESRVLVLTPKRPNGPKEKILWELLRQKDKIAKNAIREAIIRGFESENRKITKNQARSEIERLGLDLERRVSCLGGEELLKIMDFIEKLLDEPNY